MELPDEPSVEVRTKKEPAVPQGAIEFVGEGTERDSQVLLSVCSHIGGNSLCALGDAAIGPVKSLVERYQDEIDRHIRDRACPFPKRRYFENGA